MPKLPDNFVKAPSFDNPLRATAANALHKLVLGLDDPTWQSLQQASKRAGVTPETLILRALESYLSEPVRVAMAPIESEPAPPPSLRTQLVDQLREQFGRRSWFQCLLTVRALVREVRAS